MFFGNQQNQITLESLDFLVRRFYSDFNKSVEELKSMIAELQKQQAKAVNDYQENQEPVKAIDAAEPKQLTKSEVFQFLNGEFRYTLKTHTFTKRHFNSALSIYYKVPKTPELKKVVDQVFAAAVLDTIRPCYDRNGSLEEYPGHTNLSHYFFRIFIGQPGEDQ